MKHAYNELSDFLLDDRFVDWVKTGRPDPVWLDFLEQHPDKRILIDQARALILAGATLPVVDPTAGQVSRMWSAIEAARQPTVPIRRLPVWSYWAAAASVALILLLGSLLYQPFNRQQAGSQPVVNQSAAALREVVNQTTGAQFVQLPDGSTVRLEPGSRLSFPATFQRVARREVHLSGDAFFEVKKNPNQPFLVYAGELVTKVLGTSFMIRASEMSGQITVDVSTGKVSVFTRTDTRRAQKTTTPELTGMVLTPNQHARFDRNRQELVRSSESQPDQLPFSGPTTAFEFDEAPAPVIFAALEQAYGVDIIYDTQQMRNCRLTASLTDEPLFEKIRLLCESLDAHYEVTGNQIRVSGKGCAAETPAEP